MASYSPFANSQLKGMTRKEREITLEGVEAFEATFDPDNLKEYRKLGQENDQVFGTTGFDFEDISDPLARIELWGTFSFTYTPHPTGPLPNGSKGTIVVNIFRIHAAL